MSASPPMLAPSLMDRLLGACAGVAEPRPAGVESLIGDLEDLLNTCSVIPDDALAGFPEAAESLLSYGSPAPQSLSLATHRERLATARQIEQTLRRFEPRLERVRVRIDQPRAASSEGRFRVVASLREDPLQEVSFSVRVRNSSGRAHVTMERQ